MKTYTNVAIINSVAQAGININDGDIDAQILMGQFDPLGFMQYLGRCRNYTGKFYYLYHDFGKQTSLWPGDDKLENYITTIQTTLNTFNDSELTSLSDMIPLHKEYFTRVASGKYLLNKCMVANLAYKSFRDLHGSKLIEHLKQEFKETIEVKETQVFIGIDSTISSVQKAKYRQAKKKALPKQIKNNAKYLDSIVTYLDRDMNHDKALEVVENSSNNKIKAKNTGLMHLSDTRKKLLKRTIKTARQGAVSIQCLILAAKHYLDNGKSEKSIKAVLNLGSQKIAKLIKAYRFYENDYTNEPIIDTLLDDFEDQVSLRQTAEQWKADIRTYLKNIPGSSLIASEIYDSCFITKRVKVNENGSKKNRQRLEKIVRTFDDYLKGNALDDLF